MHGTVFERFIFYLATFAGVLYFATNTMILRFRLKVDVSYGVFLWGFPIQQALAHWSPGMGRTENYLLAMLLAILIGFFSWAVIEKRSIQFGKRITVAIRNKQSGMDGSK
jgi:peptidoglycan/LPS O-acetylase OafA/YrhL